LTASFAPDFHFERGHYINITPLSKAKIRNKIIYSKMTTYLFTIPLQQCQQKFVSYLLDFDFLKNRNFFFKKKSPLATFLNLTMDGEVLGSKVQAFLPKKIRFAKFSNLVNLKFVDFKFTK
jgi:hypothetical protein